MYGKVKGKIGGMSGAKKKAPVAIVPKKKNSTPMLETAAGKKPNGGLAKKSSFVKKTKMS